MTTGSETPASWKWLQEALTLETGVEFPRRRGRPRALPLFVELEIHREYESAPPRRRKALTHELAAKHGVGVRTIQRVAWYMKQHLNIGEIE